MTPRRTLVVLLAVLLFSPQLPARTNHDWANVEKLNPGTEIRVLLWSGVTLNGRVYDITDAGFHLAWYPPPQPGESWLRQIDRTAIRKIASEREPNLPDPGKWMAVGAVAGGLVGVATGGINRNGQSYNGFTGALGGAGMGALVALPVAAVVGLHRSIHHRKVVYEDQHAPPANKPH
jgi:hypothetical protein